MAPQCPQRPYRARRPLEVAQAPLMSMAVCKCAQWPGPAAPRPRGATEGRGRVGSRRASASDLARLAVVIRTSGPGPADAQWDG